MRVADTTVLAKTSKAVLENVGEVLDEHDLEALEFDLDSITVLLAEFDASKLAHENVQWVFWHLLEHVLMDVYDASEQLDDSGADALWDNMDAYIQELEDSLQKRGVKVVCSRLEALLHQYWMEAQESESGKTPILPSNEPERKNNPPDNEPEDEDEDEDEQDGE